MLSYWLCLFFLIPLPSFFTMSRMMSSKLCGLLALGSINNLALCNVSPWEFPRSSLCPCRSKALSLSCHSVLGQTQGPALQGFVSSPAAGPAWQGCTQGCVWAGPCQLERTGLQLKPSLVLSKIPCLGNFFCSFWDRRVIYCIFLFPLLSFSPPWIKWDFLY